MLPMMQVDLPVLAETATSLVVSTVDDEIAEYRRRNRSEELKGTNDLVTDADRRIEVRLAAGLCEILPGSSARGEETGASKPAHEDPYEWIIDPIDGTIDFAREFEFFTSVAALRHNGEVLLAIVYQPHARTVTVAVRGHGCSQTMLDNETAEIRRQLLRVRARVLSQTLFSIMITPKLTDHARRSSMAFAMKTLDLTLGFRVLVSQAYEAVKLAAGGINAVVSFQSRDGWTRDASRLVCEEAGGVFAVIRSTAAGGETGFVLAHGAEFVHELAPMFAAVGYEVGKLTGASSGMDSHV